MKTILIPFTIQFTVRYVLRTRVLEELVKNYNIIVVLFWEDSELKIELEQMGCQVINVEIQAYSKKFNFLSKILELNYKKKVASPSIAIDKKRNDLLFGRKSLKLKVVELLYSTLLILPFFKKIIDIQFENEVQFDNSFQLYKTLLKKNKVDVVWSITGFIKHEFLLLHAAKTLKLKLLGSILSFDNITTRGWLSIDFNHFFVWNDINQNELLRVQKKITKDCITITGAPQFDFYYKEHFGWEKRFWLNQLKLPNDRLIILFGGGYFTITPGEENWLKEIDEAISAGEIKNNPILLFRIHPNDPINRWEKILKESKNVIFDNPWKSDVNNPGQTNIDNFSICKLVSTLMYSDVHINTSSTLTLDGAVFDKPQIGPAYDSLGRKEYDMVIKDLYEREHYKPITYSGGLQLAYSRNELISLINEALVFPNKYARQRKEMIETLITYSDGMASFRLLEGIIKNV